MKKYRNYQCDICKKQAEFLNDVQHAFIDKCTLTIGCQGKLRFVKDANSRTSQIDVQSQVQQSFINPNFENLSQQQIGDFIDPSSNETNTVVFAVKDNFLVNDNSSIKFSLDEVSNSGKEFSEFTFNVSVPISVIFGRDSSINSKILTFDNDSEISIFINGQLIDSEKYDAIDNSIKFKSPIVYNSFSSATISVRIIVFKKIEKISKSITCFRNAQGLSKNAWSNVKSVIIDKVKYNLFTFTLNSQIFSINSKYNFTSAILDDSEYLSLADCVILLANSPFSALDRNASNLVNIKTLTDESNFLKYSLYFEKEMLQISSISLTEIYPPIQLLEIFEKSKEFEADSTVGVDTSLNRNINRNNSFILGPI